MALKREASVCSNEGSPKRVKKQEDETEIKEEEMKVDIKHKDDDLKMDDFRDDNIKVDIKSVRYPILGEYTTDARPLKLVKLEPTEPSEGASESRTIGNQLQKRDCFDLAAETRNLIYEYYFADSTPIAITSKNPNLVELQFPLLFSSKKTRGEAREMFYANKTFEADDVDISLGYLRALRRPQLKALTDFKIIDQASITADVATTGPPHELVLKRARFARLMRAAERAVVEAKARAAMKAKIAAQKAEEMAALMNTQTRKRRSRPARYVPPPLPVTSDGELCRVRVFTRMNREPPRTIRKIRRTLKAINYTFGHKGLKASAVKMGMLVHKPFDPVNPTDNVHQATKVWSMISNADVDEYKCVKVASKRLNMPMTDEDKKIHRPLRQKAEKLNARAARVKKKAAKMAEVAELAKAKKAELEEAKV